MHCSFEWYDNFQRLSRFLFQKVTDCSWQVLTCLGFKSQRIIFWSRVQHMTIPFLGMRRNVNRREYRNVKMCPKLKSKRSTSESQLKLKEKLPTESALENQTMNTHQNKSGPLISLVINIPIVSQFVNKPCQHLKNTIWLIF